MRRMMMWTWAAALLLTMPVASAERPGYDSRGYRLGDTAPAVESASAPVGSFALVPGHHYLTNYNSNAIVQADPAGNVVASMTLPGYTMGLRGSAFGPDGRLYVIAEVPTRYDVVVLAEDGSIVRTLYGITPISGNLSNGSIVVDDNQDVYLVATTLQKIPRHATFASELNAQAAGFDLDLLDNGNLVVVQSYAVTEWTKTGSFVRQIAGSSVITDGRGIAYSRSAQQLYVTVLGTSSAYFQLLRMNPLSGAVINQTTFVYGIDIAVRADGSIAVGSYTQVPMAFDARLNPIGFIGASSRMFVSVMPEPMFQFRDGFD